MSRPPRIPGFEYRGACRYFLTSCTRERAAVFQDPAIVDLTFTQFRRAAAQEGFALLAYCFMPDHVHLLVEGTGAKSDLKVFVKRAKEQSGTAYARAVRRAGLFPRPAALWQEGYYDHVLRRDEDARAVARYILENPIRAGLVSTPEAYPHLGSDVWSIEDLFDSVR